MRGPVTGERLVMGCYGDEDCGQRDTICKKGASRYAQNLIQPGIRVKYQREAADICL